MGWVADGSLECVVRRERQCTFEKVERHLARNIGKEDEKCVCHLRQRLVILLVCDNVALLCGRTPTFPTPEVDSDEEF